MKKFHGSLCVYILWVVGRYLDSVCVLCLWEINPSLVISLSDIARNESAVLFIALHRAAITNVPNALACDINRTGIIQKLPAVSLLALITQATSRDRMFKTKGEVAVSLIGV